MILVLAASMFFFWVGFSLIFHVFVNRQIARRRQ